MTARTPGSAEWRDGFWWARVRMPTGERVRVKMPGIDRTDEAKAKAVAVAILARVKGGAAVPEARSETIAEYAERWCASREALGLRSALNGRTDLRVHFLPHYGHVPIESVTPAILRGFVARLDDRVARRELAWKTARNVWGSVSKMFADAATSKLDALRALSRNPAENVAPPDKGETTEKQYLYPDELLAVLRCPEVPLERARLYACAVYLYSRAGELAPLTWADLNLTEGIAHIHQAEDRRRAPGEVRSTKGKVPRRFSVEPALLPLLRAMHQAKTGRLVFPEIGRADGEYGLAGVLRADLLRAGVTREALHKASRTRKRMGFHDLRATGITWMTVRGDPASLIMTRVGHQEYATTQGYIREAEALRDGFGTVFPALPSRLLSVGPTLDPWTHKQPRNTENSVGAAGFEPGSETGQSAGNHARFGEGASETGPGRGRPAGARALYEEGVADRERERTMLGLFLEDDILGELPACTSPGGDA